MLIEEFSKQTNDTILAFMSQLGQRLEVYSTITWYLCDDINWQFFYATQNEIVLVYIDYTNGIGSVEEDVIKQGFSGDDIHCFKFIHLKNEKLNVDERPSPIEHLSVRTAEFRKILDKAYGCYPMIHGIYISTTSLTNVDKAIEPFNKSANTEIRVFLQHPTLCVDIQQTPVNQDENLPGAAYWKTIVEETFKPFIGYT